jgi:hypothetical protein
VNSVRKGDQAELKVAAELATRGFGVAFPFSTSSNWDLLAWEEGTDNFLRVQVKYAELLDSGAIPVRTRTHSNTSKQQTTRYYTAQDFDVLAVWCPQKPDSCMYIAPSEFEGSSALHLRVSMSLNGQMKNIRWAYQYREFPPRGPADKTQPCEG